MYINFNVESVSYYISKISNLYGWVGFALYMLAIFLILDITRRIGELIEESRNDKEAEINESYSISRRAYDEIN